jgi:phosphoribosylformylglycinamidine cyclo-ligase
MPDFYAPGEYDLGGFAVGEVSPAQVLPRSDIKAGDVLIGIASSGCHSNGFSLLRKLIPAGREGEAISRKLLTPTRIYAKSLAPLIESKAIKGLAHITGSGFLNVPRVSEKVSYEIALPPLSQRPDIYEWVRSRCGLSLSELSQTFNLGIGMVVVVSPAQASKTLARLKKSGETAWKIGEVKPRKRGQPSQVAVTDGNETAVLDY